MSNVSQIISSSGKQWDHAKLLKERITKIENEKVESEERDLVKKIKD